MAAPPITRNEPSLYNRLLTFLANIFPFRTLGQSFFLLGVAPLVFRRANLRSLNLYPAPLPPATPSLPLPDHRTPDASGNDPDNRLAGSSSTPFGRNMPPDERRAAPSAPPMPPVQVVADKLLARDVFRPAGDQLNVLAAAWIQAMSHDWFGHVEGEADVVLSAGSGGPKCPLKAFRFKETQRRADGAFDNKRTHFWDASFVYGQDENAVRRARTGVGGLMHVGAVAGYLPRAEDGTTLVGDTQNGWVGVSLLQDLFLREHNAVAQDIAKKHAEMAGDDERLFNAARLVVSAVAAKIHTVDWTIELLKTNLLGTAMTTNWYGLLYALGLSDRGPPGLVGLVQAKEITTHGVPFCLTEEFVAVYRMHPLLPDGLPLDSGFKPLGDLVGLAGDAAVAEEDGARDVWNAIVRFPCGNMELHNYPIPLRNLTPTDGFGRALPDRVDLAALDLYRDRERGLRNFNDFRRELRLKPFKTYSELTGGNEATAQELSDVYGIDGIENVDLMVGMLAEEKIVGFAISETAFLIFLLMASRRLEADRFFTTDFNKEVYTDAGYVWVDGVKSMRDVLKRHWPDIEAKIPGEQSAFKPRDIWPVSP